MNSGAILFLSLFVACVIALVIDFIHDYQIHKHNSKMAMKATTNNN